MQILLIEDDRDVAANIAEYLGNKGYILDFAYDGLSGLHLAAIKPYDVIILDIMLPGLDGVMLLRRLRQEKAQERDTLVLMLTARDGLEDKIEGFEAGADDYLVKPFALPELHLRLQALYRRRAGHNSATVLKVGDLIFDTRQRTITRENQAIHLNRLDKKILEQLMRASPAVVSKDELETSLWRDAYVGEDVLRTHIYRLRKAVDRPFDRPLIHTLHGQGYVLKAPEIKE